MSFSEVAPTTFSLDFEIERMIGERHGIRVELWTAPERSRVVLVVSPTVTGFTVLMQGGLDEVAAMERAGVCVLETLAGVIPLVSGEAFRGGHGIVQASRSDFRQ